MISIQDDKLITEPCGCQLEIDTRTGAKRSVLKCGSHTPNPEFDERHYNELGVTNRERVATYVKEFVQGFGELKRGGEESIAMEVGAGPSPYYEYFEERGYIYTAVEPSLWACRWLRQRQLTAIHSTWEQYEAPKSTFDVVFSAHTLEHLLDPVAGIEKMVKCLKSNGVLYILVPDDTDLTNPDHLYFFAEGSLRKAVELTRVMTVESVKTLKITHHENFIYLKAVKNG